MYTVYTKNNYKLVNIYAEVNTLMEVDSAIKVLKQWVADDRIMEAWIIEDIHNSVFGYIDMKSMVWLNHWLIGNQLLPLGEEVRKAFKLKPRSTFRIYSKNGKVGCYVTGYNKTYQIDDITTYEKGMIPGFPTKDYFNEIIYKYKDTVIEVTQDNNVGVIDLIINNGYEKRSDIPLKGVYSAYMPNVGENYYKIYL